MDALPFIIAGLAIIVFAALGAVLGGLAIAEMRRNGNRDDGPDGSVVCLGLLLSSKQSVSGRLDRLKGYRPKRFGKAPAPVANPAPTPLVRGVTLAPVGGAYRWDGRLLRNGAPAEARHG